MDSFEYSDEFQASFNAINSWPVELLHVVVTPNTVQLVCSSQQSVPFRSETMINIV
jgi:hypothetical protein